MDQGAEKVIRVHAKAQRRKEKSERFLSIKKDQENWLLSLPPFLPTGITLGRINNCKMEENEIAKVVVNSALKVHKALGPGLFESAYEEVFSYELTNQGLQVLRQQPIGLIYNNIKMDISFKADIVVADKLIIEIKSVEE